jgi:hypothetical protein
MVFGFALLLQRPRLRAAILAITAFIATQTGFGLFLSAVAVPVLAVLLAQAISRRTNIFTHVAALALVIVSFLLFFYGYRPDPAVACFQFPDPKLERYPLFLSFLFLRSLETQGVGLRVYLGFGLLLACVGMASWGGWRTIVSLGREPLPLLVFVFSGFSLLFALNTAVGRSCLGPEGAYSTRYVPYLTPFFFAAYLLVSTSKARPSRTCAAILLAFCLFWAVKELVWTANWSIADAEIWRRQKTAWQDCYLAIENAKVCTAMHSLGAADVEADHIVEKLRFLRQHHLNLFRLEQR